MHQSNSNSVTASSALFQAIKNNNVDAVKTILSSEEFATGEKIDAALSKKGWPPMYLAASLGYISIIRALKEKGARVDISLIANNSMPIHIAAEYGHLELVQTLVAEFGVDPTVINDHKETPLHKAASKGHQTVVEFLCQQEGVDINAKDLHGNTPMHLASDKGHLYIVKQMCTIDKIDLKLSNNRGQNALSCAVEKQHIEIVIRLLKTGVNVYDTLVFLEKNESGVYLYRKFLSEINMLLAYFSNPSLRKNISVNKILEYLEKYINLRLRNEHRISLLDLMLQNIIDKPVKEIGVSQEVKDQILMFFVDQVINDFHINKTKQETEQAKDFEDFLVLIERLASTIENNESRARLFVKLAEKYRSLMDETADNYTALIIDAYEKAIEFSKDVDFLEETHLRLAFDYLQLNNDVPFVQNDIRDEKAKYHANLAGQSQAAVALRKKLYFGLGNHDDKDDPLGLSPIKAQNDLDKNEKLKQGCNSSAAQLLYSYKKLSSEGDLKNGPEDAQSNQNDNNTPSSRR